jgi:hypothetical protein
MGQLDWIQPTPLKQQATGVNSSIMACIGPVMNEKSKNNKKLYECNEPISIDQIRFGDLTMDKIEMYIHRFLL